jgi:hypothetical protein
VLCGWSGTAGGGRARGRRWQVLVPKQRPVPYHKALAVASRFVDTATSTLPVEAARAHRRRRAEGRIVA